MRIGFDIDDCITKTAQTFCKYSNNLFDKNLTYKLLTSKSAKFEDTGLITEKEARKVKSMYYKDRIFKVIPPYKDAVKTIKSLEDNRIYFITNRNDYNEKELREDTIYWFISYGIHNFELIFTEDKAYDIKKIKLDLFVEDNMNQVEKIKKMLKIEILVPERPWNSEFKNNESNINFVNNWMDIKSYINKHD